MSLQDTPDTPDIPDTPLWQPSAEGAQQTNIFSFMQQANSRYGFNLTNYSDLYQWSIDAPEQFWTSVWDFGKVIAACRGERVLIDGAQMPGAEWFPDARLNFAQNLLRRQDETDALVFWGENKFKRRLSWRELYQSVAQFAAALRAMGVVSGDRVAALMPNMPETVIAMLASASIGAVFSSASPDFGVQGVLDRFGQIEPKVLITVDAYYYNGKTIDCLKKTSEIVKEMISGGAYLEQVVIVPYVCQTLTKSDIADVPRAQLYGDVIACHTCYVGQQDILFEQLPFNHPLYVMYSSGTTGVPKCIVHCAGGMLLQHLKEHQLHGDVKPNDRVFYFTTCGWMMWNWLISGLASGATLLLYDGSPSLDRGAILFDYAEAERMTHFGTSAKFIDALAKFELAPCKTHKLDSLRMIFSTGSPLVPESFDYVYQNIKQDLCLSSISGGTDIVSCFALGCPILPVWRGELQCRGLGMRVEVWNDEGKPVVQEKGELVCTQPFPAMPIGFWNDPDGKKYHVAYFEKYPNVWCHGDYVELTEHGGMVIYGRSDAVLNPGGVRIGTAEIYRQVEKLPDVLESIVIGQHWEKDVRVVLFVRLRDGLNLDEALIFRIKQVIRENTTPRHVPAKILHVADIPRTKSGKIVELAVRNVVHGEPVKNIEALANPEALVYFQNRIELKE